MLFTFSLNNIKNNVYILQHKSGLRKYGGKNRIYIIYRINI